MQLKEHTHAAHSQVLKSIQQVEGAEVPRLLASSSGLDWQGIEAHTFQLPYNMAFCAESQTTDINLIAFTQGKLWMDENQRLSCRGFEIHCGDLFLRPLHTATPEARWHGISPEPVHSLHIHLDPPLFDRAIEELADRDPARITLVEHAGFSDPLLWQIGLTLRNELKNPSAMSALYAQTTAQMLVVHLLRHYATNHVVVKEHQQGLTMKQMKRVTKYVQANLTKDLTLEDLAEQTGYSPYHFARLFRQVSGDTPHQFVIRQRVKEAQHLLRNTDLPIAQIAVETGFTHQSHLTRVFKRFVSTTPKAFRHDI